MRELADEINQRGQARVAAEQQSAPLMSHRVAPRADANLGGIWYYVAKESDSAEIASRLINSITERFFLLANYPPFGTSTRR
jgi:hypothetical protein